MMGNVLEDFMLAVNQIPQQQQQQQQQQKLIVQTKGYFIAIATFN
jgi:hypothetical protein